MIAGRVLAPLRAITSATQQISDTNLHQRLAIDGPRDELTELADTIDGLLERLEVAFEAQRRFVANASHELRTPLATMRAAVDVAIGKPNVPPQSAGARRGAPRGSRRGRQAAGELPDAGARAARRARSAGSVSLAQLAGDALAARGEAIAAKQLELHTALAPVCVTGSQTLLARMVDNVIENAVRHNQARGVGQRRPRARRRDSATDRRERRAAVWTSSALTQLAQPFRRIGAERTGSQNGHGLGLSIVAAVAAAHGGILELHARPQGGLRVQITLPAATSSRNKRPYRYEGPSRRGRPQLGEQGRRGPARPGDRRRHRYDGHEAAAKLDLNPYDVVVLDRDLPGIHGDTLCQTITCSANPR